MEFGINNVIIPPTPEVNSEVFNIIALVGIAAKGPSQALTLCSNQTDDSQFGSALTGFSIPRALSVIRNSGGGQVVVVNVFNPSTHTSAVTLENDTVVSQKTKTASNPLSGLLAAVAVFSVTTGAGAGDTLAQLAVGSTNLLSGAITFTAGNTTVTAGQIVNAINANTSVSGFSATLGTNGAFTVKGPVVLGCTINGVVTTVGTITGALVIATPGAFTGGVGNVLVQNTPVSGVSAVSATATIAVTTGSTSGDILAGLQVGLVNLLSGPLTLGTNNTSGTANAIRDAINAFTGTSGFTATAATGTITLIGSTGMGATINGVVASVGTITGALVLGTPTAFANGVNGVTQVNAYTYVPNQDYTIDDYGAIKFLVAVSDYSVVRSSYNTLNASAVVAADLIGTVSGSTRTGLQLLPMCKSQLQLVPKILIVPNYNSQVTVQAAMEVIAAKYRMRTIYAPTTPGLTLAQAIDSRGPGGTLATFNTSSKRAILAYPMVYTYDPQTSTATLDDPSAAYAGFLSWNASINGLQESPSNQVMPAVLGTEIALLHDWEDTTNTAETNQLRSAGITCIFNDGGYKWWGNENASFPANSAVDCNIPVIYVNDVLTDDLTTYAIQYVDKNITSGSILSFVTAANGYYSTQATAGVIGRSSIVNYIASRNSAANLKLGKITFTRNTFYFVGMKLIVLEENMEVQLPSLPTA